MNCLCLEWAGQIVLIDCGLQFPGSHFPGVDMLTPDLGYVRSRMKDLKGIVCTHGHDDHIGGIPFLAQDGELDVWCTPFPRGLIEQKLTEAPFAREIRFHEFKPREAFDVGPFRFDPIPVAHSIIESVAFAIETPIGTLIHSGDFKHDANELGGQKFGFEPFKEYGDRGVLCLLSDSTNAERAGHTLSEKDIANSFETIFAQQSSRLLIALFASNIRRVENLLWLAKRHGKKVALAGRSMHSYTQLAHQQRTLNLPDETLVLLEDIGSYPDERVIVLMTGSQAEPQSALVRISQGIHKEFQIKNGDKVIMSSRFIPGNERNITSMIDHLYRQGAEVIYESIHQIHVSGHGFQEELLMMLKAARPKFFIPIHGEYRHLAKHAKLARESGVKPENVAVIEDGQVVEIDRDRVALAEKLPLQKGIVVDGGFMQGDETLFTQRNNLSKTGIVFAVLMRDIDRLELVETPRITTYGLLWKKGEDAARSIEEAEDLLEDVYPELARNQAELHESLRLELRRFFRHRVSHKPVVIPLILDI